MDYSKWTDFAINTAVGAATGEARNSEPLLKLVIRNSNGRRYDPCNNPADAWPIIENNKISITCHQSRDFWAAVFNRHSMASHANPLTAAMECYLMMQGDE